jgi:hypothetical protein
MLQITFVSANELCIVFSGAFPLQCDCNVGYSTYKCACSYYLNIWYRSRLTDFIKICGTFLVYVYFMCDLFNDCQ